VTRRSLMDLARKGQIPAYPLGSGPRKAGVSNSPNLRVSPRPRCTRPASWLLYRRERPGCVARSRIGGDTLREAGMGESAYARRYAQRALALAPDQDRQMLAALTLARSRDGNVPKLSATT
jgi:hypothetical protein